MADNFSRSAACGKARSGGRAAFRTKSLYHAAQRLYPDTQDQTFWNRLRANLPKQVPALERRLNELLRLPRIAPPLHLYRHIQTQ